MNLSLSILLMFTNSVFSINDLFFALIIANPLPGDLLIFIIFIGSSFLPNNFIFPKDKIYPLSFRYILVLPFTRNS